MWNSLVPAVACLSIASFVAAQEFELPANIGDPAALAGAMPALAKQVLAAYKDEDREAYLGNRFRLQIVAGQYSEAVKTLNSLRDLRRSGNPARAAWVDLQHEIYASARALQGSDKVSFEEAYQRSCRNALRSMDDHSSALLIRSLRAPDQQAMRRRLRDDLDQRKGKRTVSLAGALKLIRDYQAEEAYRGENAGRCNCLHIGGAAQDHGRSPPDPARVHHLRRSQREPGRGSTHGLEWLCSGGRPRARKGLQPRQTDAL